MRILQIVFLLGVCGCSQACNLRISDILEIAKLSKDVVTDVLQQFYLIFEARPKDKESLLLEQFQNYSNKSNMLNTQLEGIESQLLDGIVVYTELPSELKLKLLQVNINIDIIKLKYKDMATLLNITDNGALEVFARSIVSHSNRPLSYTLDRIHEIIGPSKYGVPKVFRILDDIMKVQGNSMFCNMQTSTQQLVLHLYNTLALTELKGFLMMQFSYLLLQIQTSGRRGLYEDKFSKDFDAAKKLYKDRTATTLNLTLEAVKVADVGLWKCDPYKQVKNETYIEITGFLQGYIENVQNLNAQGSCNMKCLHFNDIVSYKCDDHGGKNMFCTKNRQCKGKIYNCYFIPNATVCHDGEGTNRRYKYIEQAGKVLGPKKECAHMTSLKGGLPGSTKCDYCMCICDEQGANSDRFFNLRDTVSDIDRNMVVTGLRFVKKNRIIHLQIQQGKLLPRAQIDLTTVHWKPVEDYRIDDDRVHDGDGGYYHTLTWEKRSFDLDDLIMGPEELITGVRFGMMFGSHVNFQIRATPFNFKTGTLEGEGEWKRNGTTSPRPKLNLDNKDIPTKSTHRSLPLSQTGMYLDFTPTDLYMDAAQTTVPFIDAQAVESATPVPLSGAGVLYKGSTNFGGFIYPKITTYDYSRLFLNATDDTLELKYDYDITPR